jgi:hypothetical protein
MSVQSWAALIVSICTIVAFAAGSIKWLVKHYLAELRPNSGSSIKDQVTRLENKVDKLYEIFIEHMRDSNK